MAYSFDEILLNSDPVCGHTVDAHLATMGRGYSLRNRSVRHTSASADRYHTIRRGGSIELVYQCGAMFQHRALVDRALVGDLAAVDREWRVQKDRAGDPGR